MRDLLLDITRLCGRRLQGLLATGVDRVSLAYVHQFAERAVAVIRVRRRLIELSARNSAVVFDRLLAPPTRFDHRLAWAIGKSVGNSGFRRARKMQRQQRFLFNTGHSGLELGGYASGLRHRDIQILFFVHDLIPMTHPEYCRPAERARHTARMDTVLDVGRGVIVNSAATLVELRAYAGRMHRPLPPAAIAWPAATPLPAPASSSPERAPYFVTLGTIEPRKNHWMLLQVWRRLVARLGTRAPRLVVIGRRGWECENVADMLDRCEVLRDFVIERPRCSDAELATYLHHARALLFPSFAEGFGLPLVEALSSGVPVIASDLPVFREIAGDIPTYRDPLDGEGWTDSVEEFSRADSVVRLAQLRRLQDFKAPTWSAHFGVVEGLLDRLRHG